MPKTRVRQFQATDASGKSFPLVEYRIVHESDEIGADRMTGDPIVIHAFETVDGSQVEKNADGSFTILSANIVVREV